MMEYKTESGSTYQVRFAEDGGTTTEVRRVVRSALSESERVSDEWKVAEVDAPGIGYPLTIHWGLGLDEYSTNANTVQVGIPTEGGTVARLTQTTRVVSIDIIS